jgi:hypothetical protein
MPTTWYYISGCPLLEECNAHKVSGKKKSLTFSALTMEDAVEKCAQHMIQSSLHKRSRSEAYDIAWSQNMSEHDEPTEDEMEDSQVKPIPVAKARRLAALETTETDPDPLVTDISIRVAALVNSDISSRGSRSSSSGLQTRRDAKRNIADAEEAARKAQSIAISAAQAFGEVAAKLNRAHNMLDVD